MLARIVQVHESPGASDHRSSSLIPKHSESPIQGGHIAVSGHPEFHSQHTHHTMYYQASALWHLLDRVTEN